MGQHYVGVLWQLLRLRQACNHPLLVKGVAHKQAVPAAEVRRRAAADPPAGLEEEPPLCCLCASLCWSCRGAMESAVLVRLGC